LDGMAQCKPNACDVYHPANGALGSCKSRLKHAESCMPVCNDGLEISGGPLTCNAGQLSGVVVCAPPKSSERRTTHLTMCKISPVDNSNSDVYSYTDITRADCTAKTTELNQCNASVAFKSTWVDFSDVF
jgi:hypothetical protein